MNNIVEFDKVADFIVSATHNGLRVVEFEPDDEDPITHYYALEKTEEITIGYFGFGNGADADYGFIARTPELYFLQLN